jgi:hypothetical protein
MIMQIHKIICRHAVRFYRRLTHFVLDHFIILNHEIPQACMM